MKPSDMDRFKYLCKDCSNNDPNLFAINSKGLVECSSCKTTTRIIKFDRKHNIYLVNDTDEDNERIDS